MESDIRFSDSTRGPSLRSEFGSTSLPNEGILTFGGRADVSGRAKTYAFSRYDKPQVHAAPTPEPVPQPAPAVSPVIPQSAPAVSPVIPQAAPIPQPQPGAAGYETAFSPQTPSQVTPQEIYIQDVQPEPQYASAPPEYSAYESPPAPSESAQAAVQRTTVVRGGPWITIAVIAALLLGLVVGAFGYRLWADGMIGGNSEPGASGSPSGETGMSPSEIFDACCPSVVGITAVPFSAASSSALPAPAPMAGTGFLISEDGYLLTNYHVVRAAVDLTVTLYDGRTCKARLVTYEDKTSDLALLKIEETGLRPVTFGDSDKLRVGERVCTVGNPFGELSYSLTVGYLSALERNIQTDKGSLRVLQTDTAINSGSSGGPLFDSEGRVIGIVTAKYNSGSESDAAPVEGLGFAIPINDAKTLADGWVKADRSAQD